MGAIDAGVAMAMEADAKLMDRNDLTLKQKRVIRAIHAQLATTVPLSGIIAQESGLGSAEGLACVEVAYEMTLDLVRNAIKNSLPPISELNDLSPASDARTAAQAGARED